MGGVCMALEGRADELQDILLNGCQRSCIEAHIRVGLCNQHTCRQTIDFFMENSPGFQQFCEGPPNLVFPGAMAMTGLVGWAPRHGGSHELGLAQLSRSHVAYLK